MDQMTIQAARKAATKYDVPLANLLAVIQVESNGQIFATIKHDGIPIKEPLIRWEGHYFDKRLDPKTRATARAKGLADPKAGGVKNPSSQQARWDQLFLPACGIDLNAAIESVSFGVGQVMGAHWDKLGYASPAELMAEARDGVEGQIELMLRYCQTFGLLDELRRGDFAGFARGYNGPNYRKYSYDTNMAAAAKTFARTIAGSTAGTTDQAKAAKASGMVRLGTEGAKVRELQSLLRRGGYTVDVDGDFGPATKRALEAFQEDAGLEVDGLVGPKTWQALEAYKVDPDEQPGVPSPAESLTATPQGKQGLALTLFGGGGLQAAKEVVDSAKDQLEVVTGTIGMIDTIYATLTFGSVTLALAGIAWAGYGWYRANTTRGVAAA